MGTGGDARFLAARKWRLLSVRAYDADGVMVDAEVCEGEGLEEVIARFFAGERVAYLHLHNARPGCFACRVERA